MAEQYETEATIAAAERLLFIDPVHEGAWQALIRAHMDRGDRAAARLAFDRVPPPWQMPAWLLPSLRRISSDACCACSPTATGTSTAA